MEKDIYSKLSNLILDIVNIMDNLDIIDISFLVEDNRTLNIKLEKD